MAKINCYVHARQIETEFTKKREFIINVHGQDQTESRLKWKVRICEKWQGMAWVKEKNEGK